MGNFNIIKNIQSNSDARVRLMISDKTWLEATAVEQLKKTAELDGMCCCVGMPDLHPGKGQPIGAAFISRNIIHPYLIGSDIGCGMGLWKLSTKFKKLKRERWTKKLVGLDDNWTGDINKYLDECGLHAPNDELKRANTKLGTIGGGNHFTEVQAVEEVFDKDAFLATGLDQQSVVLLVHSGSRGLGQAILREHVDTFKSEGLTTNGRCEGEAGHAKTYLQKHNYAVAWARANRALIALRFCECLGVEREHLLDVTHNFVEQLQAKSVAALDLPRADNADYWIHRKGATPANQGLVMIPGSRGSLSYLVKPRADRAEVQAQGGFSLAHGAGRKWKRSDARGRLEARYKANDLLTTKSGCRVICKPRNLLYEEAPQAYKNIDLVVDDLVKAGMIDLVASFQPIISYKTRKDSK